MKELPSPSVRHRDDSRPDVVVTFAGTSAEPFRVETSTISPSEIDMAAASLELMRRKAPDCLAIRRAALRKFVVFVCGVRSPVRSSKGTALEPFCGGLTFCNAATKSAGATSTFPDAVEILSSAAPNSISPSFSPCGLSISSWNSIQTQRREHHPEGLLRLEGTLRLRLLLDASRQLAEDLPFGLGLSRRVHHFVAPLCERVGKVIGKGQIDVVLLQEVRDRQDIVGPLRGLVHVEVDGDEQLEPLHRFVEFLLALGKDSEGSPPSTIRARMRSGPSIIISLASTDAGYAPVR